MSNCFVDMAHPMYGFNAQDKNGVITVSVTEEIRPCVRWKANKQLRVDTGTVVGYIRKDVPEDQLNCDPVRCMNTGTLYINSAEGVAKTTYQVRSDADDFALGFNFIYVKVPQEGKYQLKVTVSDFYDTAQTNAYVYTSTFNAGTPGYILRTVDLTDTTVMTQTGTGWNPSDHVLLQTTRNLIKHISV